MKENNEHFIAITNRINIGCKFKNPKKTTFHVENVNIIYHFIC